MGALVGLGVGVGLLLVWSAFALPRQPRATTPTSTALRRLLGRAGLAEVARRACSRCARSSSRWRSWSCRACRGPSRWPWSSPRWPPTCRSPCCASGPPGACATSPRCGRRRSTTSPAPYRAGLSLPDAVAALGTTGPEALRADFARFALDYQVTGRFGECLDRLKDHLADPVGDRVIEGLRLAREVGGGDLGRLLRNLSGFLRDDARTRSELESRQAWTVNGARLAVSAPWIVLLLMSFQTTAIRRYATTGGVLVLGIGLALCVIAYAAMMRIGRLPVEKRILS